MGWNGIWEELRSKTRGGWRKVSGEVNFISVPSIHFEIYGCVYHKQSMLGAVGYTSIGKDMTSIS